jgi:hypothetical protein
VVRAHHDSFHPSKPLNLIGLGGFFVCGDLRWGLMVGTKGVPTLRGGRALISPVDFGLTFHPSKPLNLLGLGGFFCPRGFVVGSAVGRGDVDGGHKRRAHLTPTHPLNPT